MRDGQTVFVPEASSLHRDGALDVRGYCRRMEWGYEYMIPFCQKYPNLPANLERERVNGYQRRGAGMGRENADKLMKSVLVSRPMREVLYEFAAVLERVAPDSKTLDRTYRLLLGLAIFAGYRKGLKRFGPVEQSGLSARVEVLERRSRHETAVPSVSLAERTSAATADRPPAPFRRGWRYQRVFPTTRPVARSVAFSNDVRYVETDHVFVTSVYGKPGD